MKFENQRLSVGVSKTVNTGDYESLKIHCGLSVDIPDDMDVDDAYNDLFDEVSKQVLDYEEAVLGGEK